MAELNPNRVVMGLAIESTRGTAETLVSTDFDRSFIDVEQLQYASDHAPAGKAASGSLINDGKSYSRTVGATGAVKMEVKASATPTVEPADWDTFKVAGFKTGVIDAGTNDNYEAYYDGKPNCNTATIVTDIEACDGTGYRKGVKGAVIADAKVTVEGAGAPVIFSGSISGALYTKAPTASIETPTFSTDDCVLGTGMTATINSTLYNFTKFEWSSNLGAAPVTDMSDSANTNISHYNLSDGGDPTITFSAIPVQTDVGDDWSKMLGNTVDTDLVFENADMKIIIESPQITDIQDANEAGVMIQDQTMKCGGIRLQLK